MKINTSPLNFIRMFSYDNRDFNVLPIKWQNQPWSKIHNCFIAI